MIANVPQELKTAVKNHETLSCDLWLNLNGHVIANSAPSIISDTFQYKAGLFADNQLKPGAAVIPSLKFAILRYHSGTDLAAEDWTNARATWSVSYTFNDGGTTRTVSKEVGRFFVVSHRVETDHISVEAYGRDYIGDRKLFTLRSGDTYPQKAIDIIRRIHNVIGGSPFSPYSSSAWIPIFPGGDASIPDPGRDLTVREMAKYVAEITGNIVYDNVAMKWPWVDETGATTRKLGENAHTGYMDELVLTEASLFEKDVFTRGLTLDGYRLIPSDAQDYAIYQDYGGSSWTYSIENNPVLQAANVSDAQLYTLQNVFCSNKPAKMLPGRIVTFSNPFIEPGDYFLIRDSEGTVCQFIISGLTYTYGLTEEFTFDVLDLDSSDFRR